MLNESCVPVLLKAIDKICKLDMLDQAAEDCVLNATKCFQRLLKTSSNTPTQAGDNVAEQRLKELGGIDTYLNAMEAFREVSSGSSSSSSSSCSSGSCSCLCCCTSSSVNTCT